MIESKEVIAFFKDTGSYINGNQIIDLRRVIIHNLIGEPDGKSILDIGCGDGTLTIDYLKNNRITFLDITAEMIELVRSKISDAYSENAQIRKINIFDFYSENKFDIIVCIGVYAHVPDTLLLTKKIKSLLKNDGLAVVQFTNGNALISRINRWKNIIMSRNKYKYRVNNHSTGEIEEIFSLCNFKILERSSYWPVSPVFSFLPGSFKKRAVFYFFKVKFLAKLGSEKVFLITKS